MVFENRDKSIQLSFKPPNDEHLTIIESAYSNSLDNFIGPQAQCYRSNLSDPHSSFADAYGSPFNVFSAVNTTKVGLISKNLDSKLAIEYISSCSTNSNPDTDMASKSDLKSILRACAEAISNKDFKTATRLLNLLENLVSVTGEPIERLGAYMLEGLRAKMISSGSIIYKKLECKKPTGPELMSYMRLLYQICPYYMFAYHSANFAILEKMKHEKEIHIIDFQIAQGSQWMFLIENLAKRPDGPPNLRITGFDDSNSTHTRGGGLDLVGQRLLNFATSRGVLFEFNGVAMSGCEVKLENLRVRHGEALAVNFPYVLHHIPDESVSIENHRDRLLRMVKSLSPKIVTLVEQEMNTNTAPFFARCRETLDYYSAMFESIDAALSRNDKLRIGVEKHCLARDIVNIIACEGAERVERHEPFGKWRSRFMMAGFSLCPLSDLVCSGVGEVLKGSSDNFRLANKGGVLFLGWKNRFLYTSSAWK